MKKKLSREKEKREGRKTTLRLSVLCEMQSAGGGMLFCRIVDG
jgi:hypothetical protein